MQARNPRFTRDNSIDLEIEHEKFGWIPFNAREDDLEEMGRTLYARAITGEFGSIAAYVAPPPEIPQVVSRFQAKAALDGWQLLDEVEALMADSNTPMIARLAWQEALEFRRDSPTVLAMATSLGLTSEQLDQLFITAASIEA